MSALPPEGDMLSVGIQEEVQCLPPHALELAGHILDRKAGHFDPEEFKNEYELALRKLVKRKAAGHTIEAPATHEPPSNVVNIMDALKDSLKRKKTTSASNRKKSHRPKSSKRLRKAS